MSNVSPTESAFDFWEFVSCAKCHLPFMPEPGHQPQTPFWLTECGHVICNAHLNADQSCGQCMRPGIQLTPLQLDMDPPMCNWFRPLDNGLDTVLYAARYQQDTMANQIRYYRNKYAHHRSLIERLKREAADVKGLKRANEELRRTNEQLRQQLGLTEEPAQTLNAHGKRPMVDHYRPQTHSSPRSIATPLGPNRLTLPPGQEPPAFFSNHRSDNNDSHKLSHTPHSDPLNGHQRPSSSQFVRQYAYAPPQTPQLHTPQLSHTQAAPLRQAERSRQSLPKQGPPTTNAGSWRSPQQLAMLTERRNAPASGSAQLQSTSRDRRPTMGPPANPQNVQALTTTQSRAAPLDNVVAMHFDASNGSGPQASSTGRPMRFLPASNRFAPSGGPQFAPSASNSGRNQRFVPRTPSSGAQRLVPAFASGSRAPSRPGTVNALPSGGGHRVPFMHGIQGSFG